MTIYETRFNPETQEITQDSEPSTMDSFDEAVLMHGDPVVSRGCYQIHEGGLLLSVFPWSIPNLGLGEGSDVFWGGK